MGLVSEALVKALGRLVIRKDLEGDLAIAFGFRVPFRCGHKRRTQPPTAILRHHIQQKNMTVAIAANLINTIAQPETTHHLLRFCPYPPEGRIHCEVMVQGCTEVIEARFRIKFLVTAVQKL